MLLIVYLSRPCFPGEIVGLLKTEMKQLSIMCVCVIISRITRMKRLRKVVRNLRNPCASFFWRSPVAVPELVTAAPSSSGNECFAVLTCWLPELCVLRVAVPHSLHLSPVLVVLEDL